MVWPSNWSTSVKYSSIFIPNFFFVGSVVIFLWCFIFFSYFLCLGVHRKVRLGNKHTRLWVLGSQQQQQKEWTKNIKKSNPFFCCCFFLNNSRCTSHEMHRIKREKNKTKSVNVESLCVPILWVILFRCCLAFSRRLIHLFSWWNYFIIFAVYKNDSKFSSQRYEHKNETNTHKTVSLWERCWVELRFAWGQTRRRSYKRK